MFTDKNDIYINSINMAPFLTNLKFQYSKVWGDDTGRNSLSAIFSGTFKGVNIKIVLTFKRNLKPNELNILSPVFNAPSQTVKYRHPETNSIREFTSYSGDWEINYTGINKNNGVQISFVDRGVIL